MNTLAYFIFSLSVELKDISWIDPMDLIYKTFYGRN
jgi:hypothetical protein